MQKTNKHILTLHLLVFIWGWTPILGKLISIEALQLVWFRILMTVLIIALYLAFTRHTFRVNKKQLPMLFLTGGIIALHWVAFYHAIKVSNVAVTLSAFSTGAFFTALLDPLFHRRKIIKHEILFGLVIIAAISTLFKVEIRYALGLLFGILAAFTSSLFTVMNSQLVKTVSPPVLSFYELLSGFICLNLYLVFSGDFTTSFFTISNQDYLFLLILSSVATAFPFVASAALLKNINPYTISLTLNLETIYGIVFAYFIWKDSEQMTPVFYIVTAVILAVLFANGLLRKKGT